MAERAWTLSGTPKATASSLTPSSQTAPWVRPGRRRPHCKRLRRLRHRTKRPAEQAVLRLGQDRLLWQDHHKGHAKQPSEGYLLHTVFLQPLRHQRGQDLYWPEDGSHGRRLRPRLLHFFPDECGGGG